MGLGLNAQWMISVREFDMRSGIVLLLRLLSGMSNGNQMDECHRERCSDEEAQPYQASSDPCLQSVARSDRAYYEDVTIFCLALLQHTPAHIQAPRHDWSIAMAVQKATFSFRTYDNDGRGNASSEKLTQPRRSDDLPDTLGQLVEPDASFLDFRWSSESVRTAFRTFLGRWSARLSLGGRVKLAEMVR